ncbi:KTSC domain-containing protein [Roseibium sp. SCP14]|uniref:KTSC domain-containing protein n=1 Tax=Roseibium sp. SCP14 TaxID=3141375 RepID=UPI00333DB5F0
MYRQPVSSSNIASIGYDEATQTLEIEFLDNSVYQYFNVPANIYEAIMAAPSHGVFLNANIKGQFAYERIC